MPPKLQGLLFTLLFAPFISQAQIVNIETARLEQGKQGWQGLLDFRFYSFKNATHLLKLNNHASVQYTRKKHTFLFLNDYNIILSNSDELEQNAFQHLRYGLMLDSVLVWEAFTQNQFDRIQLIKQRVLLGTGPRVRFLEKGLVHSFTGVAYMFEYEEEMHTGNVHRQHRLSTYLNLKFTPSPWVKFLNTTYFQPRLDNPSDFRLMSSNILLFKFNKYFSFLTDFNIVYDSNPVEDPNVSMLNYKLSNGISVKF